MGWVDFQYFHLIPFNCLFRMYFHLNETLAGHLQCTGL